MPSRQPAGRRRYFAAYYFGAVAGAAGFLTAGLAAVAGFAAAGRCCSCLCDGDVINLHRAIRPVVGITAHAGNLFHQSDGGFVALAEDGVSAVQMRVGNFCNKELRAVGVRTGVGVGQASGTVKLQGWGSFILELEANVAASAAGRIAALDHEIGNHAVEDGAIVEGDAMLLGVRTGLVQSLVP